MEVKLFFPPITTIQQLISIYTKYSAAINHGHSLLKERSYPYTFFWGVSLGSHWTLPSRLFTPHYQAPSPFPKTTVNLSAPMVWIPTEHLPRWLKNWKSSFLCLCQLRFPFPTLLPPIPVGSAMIGGKRFPSCPRTWWHTEWSRVTFLSWECRKMTEESTVSRRVEPTTKGGQHNICWVGKGVED